MKGIVLAGGFGTRLRPMTKIINKHLFPIYDRPMIYYPLQTLVGAGIDRIMLVTGGENVGDFLRLLGNGNELGIKELQYTYQSGATGIAGALKLAEDFADGGDICVMLGDNITDVDLTNPARAFTHGEAGCARIFLKEVPDPHRYGIAEIDGNKVTKIVEKPSEPKTNLCVTGIYIYDNQVWDMINRIKPSKRGELEITDINNMYAQTGTMTWELLKDYWIDAGTLDSMLEASVYMAGLKASH